MQRGEKIWFMCFQIEDMVEIQILEGSSIEEDIKILHF